MNEVENQLAELIKKGIEVAEKTGEFAIEQAPLLLQEFYTWHIAKSVLLVLTFIIAKILVGRLGNLFSYADENQLPKGKENHYYLKRDGKYYYSSYSDGDSEQYGISITAKILSYGFFIGVAIHIYRIAFIVLAPKLYLIEYFIK